MSETLDALLVVSQLRDDVKRLTAERDEARHRLTAERDEARHLNEDYGSELAQSRNKIELQRRQIEKLEEADIARLTAERDEARQVVAKLVAEMNPGYDARIAKLTIERDEAIRQRDLAQNILPRHP